MKDPNTPIRPGDTPEVPQDAHRGSPTVVVRRDDELLQGQLAACALFARDVRDRRTNQQLPKVKAPTLVVYGREDVPLVVSGLNDLWTWVDNELTLLVVPGAGHGPHAEMPEFVTPRIMDWLAARAHPALVYPRSK